MVPSLHFVSGYHDNSEYINSLAKTIKTHEYYGKQDKIVFLITAFQKNILKKEILTTVFVRRLLAWLQNL